MLSAQQSVGRCSLVLPARPPLISGNLSHKRRPGLRRQRGSGGCQPAHRPVEEAKGQEEDALSFPEPRPATPPLQPARGDGPAANFRRSSAGLAIVTALQEGAGPRKALNNFQKS